MDGPISGRHLWDPQGRNISAQNTYTRCWNRNVYRSSHRNKTQKANQQSNRIKTDDVTFIPTVTEQHSGSIYYVTRMAFAPFDRSLNALQFCFWVRHYRTEIKAARKCWNQQLHLHIICILETWYHRDFWTNKTKYFQNGHVLRWVKRSTSGSAYRLSRRT